MKKRIICVGNRFAPEDAAGSRVYARLLQLETPLEVEVIDGGLGGLDLLRFLEGAERIVFVDAVKGLGQPGEVVVLRAGEVTGGMSAGYDHAAGLAYLLRVLPEVVDGTIPDVFVVGIEGFPDDGAIVAAAEASLQLAVRGRARRAPLELARFERRG